MDYQRIKSPNQQWVEDAASALHRGLAHEAAQFGLEWFSVWFCHTPDYHFLPLCGPDNAGAERALLFVGGNDKRGMAGMIVTNATKQLITRFGSPTNPSFMKRLLSISRYTVLLDATSHAYRA